MLCLVLQCVCCFGVCVAGVLCVVCRVCGRVLCVSDLRLDLVCGLV